MNYIQFDSKNVSKNDKLGVIYGKIAKSDDLVIITDKLRTKSYFEYLSDSDSEFFEHPVLGQIDRKTRKEDIQRGIELAREFLQKFNLTFTKANGVESTYIEAPNKHIFEDVHDDESNYGQGITLILYIRVDKTIVDGGLKIFHNLSDDLNDDEIPEEVTNDFFRIDARCEDDDFVNFVIMDGSVSHQVEKINGTGVREAVIYFLSTKNEEDKFD